MNDMSNVPLQSKDEIEQWYDQEDPWNYEDSIEDRKRKDILLHELPEHTFRKTLDIGCGHGFVTRDLPGKHVIGIDISEKAIVQARKLGIPKKLQQRKFEYFAEDLFTLSPNVTKHKFDLILITGVLYPQYIGQANTLVYHIIDQLLAPDGILVSVHISEWYTARFPYLLLQEHHYPFHQFTHHMEIYSK